MSYHLVTGGAGFIGSNFISYFLRKYPSLKIINLDKLTYASNLKYLEGLENNPNYTFIHADICEAKVIDKIFNQYDIEKVIHFAAESHVDNSISGPRPFIETNIVGTFNLIEACRKFWTNNPHKRFHHVSTDEVFGSLDNEGFFTENTPYKPNSPYSASKASSDHLVRAYHQTYGLNCTISNCSNNFGPNQNKEKLIPTVIRKAIKNESIPIYGKGTNIRDWLFVSDHVEAIDIILSKAKAGENYNIGGDNEVCNIELAKQICRILDKVSPAKREYESLISYVKDRPGHDFRYAIDCSKLKNDLKWFPSESFEKNLKSTVEWYLQNTHFLFD